MITQRGILRAPEFVLPGTTSKSSRAVDYRLKDTRTIHVVWYQLPTFYKNLAAGTIAIVLGTAAGAVTPLLTQALERWQYF